MVGYERLSSPPKKESPATGQSRSARPAILSRNRLRPSSPLQQIGHRPSTSRHSYIKAQPINNIVEPVQLQRENKTGLPDNLKLGLENLSGLSLDDVRIHYNSDKPARLGALAYTQGTDIHIGTGQEKHLAHEAWHIVQQAKGRVQPTIQMRGLKLNNDERLELEASRMGEIANKQKHDYLPNQINNRGETKLSQQKINKNYFKGMTIQRMSSEEYSKLIKEFGEKTVADFFSIIGADPENVEYGEAEYLIRHQPGLFHKNTDKRKAVLLPHPPGCSALSTSSSGKMGAMNSSSSEPAATASGCFCVHHPPNYPAPIPPIRGTNVRDGYSNTVNFIANIMRLIHLQKYSDAYTLLISATKGRGHRDFKKQLNLSGGITGTAHGNPIDSPPEDKIEWVKRNMHYIDTHKIELYTLWEEPQDAVFSGLAEEVSLNIVLSTLEEYLHHLQWLNRGTLSRLTAMYKEYLYKMDPEKAKTTDWNEVDIIAFYIENHFDVNIGLIERYPCRADFWTWYNKVYLRQ